MCAHLPFDTWRTLHFSIQTTTEALINDSGVIADTEPYGLFIPLIHATSNNGDLHSTRDCQGLFPDLLITFPTENGPYSSLLAELKCLSEGATWYQSNWKTVDQRAKHLPKEYCGSIHGQEGPLQQCLKGFGGLQCLVAGQYGDVSQHYHDLLAKLATSKAAHISETEGHPLSNLKCGLLLHQLCRRLSVSIIRAQSSCLLSRLGHFQPGAKEEANRRALTKQREELLSQD